MYKRFTRSLRNHTSIFTVCQILEIVAVTTATTVSKLLTTGCFWVVIESCFCVTAAATGLGQVTHICQNKMRQYNGKSKKKMAKHAGNLSLKYENLVLNIVPKNK